ncbi:hypothetical protein [Streptomyces sp. RFCAC02]|uniref:hypothetical protein n=1 Tax=Streptomyces sp. RFCAC02 TaxID=2499143 RepID=UPI00102240FE|nr:hypothetical protein [Streptomyces sp. RFCAC02]
MRVSAGVAAVVGTLGGTVLVVLAAIVLVAGLPAGAAAEERGPGAGRESVDGERPPFSRPRWDERPDREERREHRERHATAPGAAPPEPAAPSAPPSPSPEPASPSLPPAASPQAATADTGGDRVLPVLSLGAGLASIGLGIGLLGLRLRRY